MFSLFEDMFEIGGFECFVVFFEGFIDESFDVSGIAGVDIIEAF